MELDFGKPVPGSVRQGAQTSQWHFYHFCCFTSQVWKGDRDPFSQFPAHQGRAKAAESRQELLWRAIKSRSEEHGNHLMKAICWCWAHLTQVWFQGCLEMTQWREGRLVRTPEKCLHRINHHPFSPGERSRRIWWDLVQKWLCNVSITSFRCDFQHLLATALSHWGAEMSENVVGVTKFWNLSVT